MNEKKIYRIAEFLADDIESEAGPKVGPVQKAVPVAVGVSAATKVATFGGSILAESNDGMIEFLYDPINGSIQIGMGGEWWGGKVKNGKNVYHHHKESVDPAYKPVTMYIRETGHRLSFDVMGGFGSAATFSIKAEAV
jgi:hypothetical protein